MEHSDIWKNLVCLIAFIDHHIIYYIDMMFHGKLKDFFDSTLCIIRVYGVTTVTISRNISDVSELQRKDFLIFKSLSMIFSDNIIRFLKCTVNV